MKKEFEGIVIEILDNEMTKIKLARHGDCANCGSCAGDGAVIIDANNKLGAKVGQRVMVEVANLSMIRSSFVMFVVPLFSTLFSVYFGSLLSNSIMVSETLSQIIFGSVGFMLSLIYIRHYDKKQKSKSKMPEIIRTI